MSVELLQNISLAAFVVAGVLFLAAVTLFFLFNVPKIFGEVTGSTARKAIANIRQQNEQTGNKAYKPSPVNAERGKLTDKITPSGRLERKVGNSGVSVGTQKLQKQEEFSDIPDETMPQCFISDEAGATSVLDCSFEYEDEASLKKVFAIEYEIVFCGSNEIIE